MSSEAAKSLPSGEYATDRTGLVRSEWHCSVSQCTLTTRTARLPSYFCTSSPVSKSKTPTNPSNPPHATCFPSGDCVESPSIRIISINDDRKWTYISDTQHKLGLCVDLLDQLLRLEIEQVDFALLAARDHLGLIRTVRDLPELASASVDRLLHCACGQVQHTQLRVQRARDSVRAGIVAHDGDRAQHMTWELLRDADRVLCNVPTQIQRNGFSPLGSIQARGERTVTHQDLATSSTEPVSSLSLDVQNVLQMPSLCAFES